LINDLLDAPKPRDLSAVDPNSELLFASSVLEAIEVEHRNLKKGHDLLQGRAQELATQIDIMKGTSTYVPTHMPHEHQASYHMD
jgi:hypothetical protein